MKRKIENTRKENNRKNSIINIFNISSILFSNKIQRENNNSMKNTDLLYLDASKFPTVSNESLGTHHQFESSYFPLDLDYEENTIVQIHQRLEEILGRPVKRNPQYFPTSTIHEIMEENEEFTDFDYEIFERIVVIPRILFDNFPSRFFEFANQPIEV